MVKCALAIASLLGALLSNGVTWGQPPEGEIVLSNDSARVTHLSFRPGAGTGRHLGLEPELGIVVEGELTLDTPKGREILRPRSAYWIPGLTPHDVRNESGQPAKLWDVLLKRCE